ncbi:MAG TPA: STAS domain-containing protein [Verrucomicrobiae bacterium]|nr:STAS domain-containing protein [Verrucomicrobiae bacterium]
MNDTPILVAVLHDIAHIKVVGRANFETATHFKTAFDALQKRGFRHFAIDLADCAQMDSTFLGVLAGSAMNLSRGTGGKGGPAIELFRPNDRIVKLLSDLGVGHLLKTTRKTDQAMPYEAAPAAETTPTTMAQTSLEAHETLMALNPNNRVKFKDVVTFLKEDLARVSPNAPPPEH